MDESRHDAYLALVRLDDAGTVGADDSGGVLTPEGVLDVDHVQGGDAVGDDHHQADLGIDGLHDGTLGEGRGHVDHTGVHLVQLLDGVLTVLEDGQTQVHLAGLPGGDSSHHLGVVLQGLFGLEGPLLPGDALADDVGVLVHPDIGSLGEHTFHLLPNHQSKNYLYPGYLTVDSYLYIIFSPPPWSPTRSARMNSPLSPYSSASSPSLSADNSS